MLKTLREKINNFKKTYKYAGNLIYSSVAIILVFVVLFSASFAWFTMSKNVNATGMKVSIETTSSLVISTLNSTEDGGIASRGAPSKVTFTTNENLNPATHDDDYTTYTGGLKYVINLEAVSSSSGYADEYDFGNAVNTEKKKYYIDRIVYVASAFKPLENCTALNLEITDISDFENTAFNAASVDIYVIPNITVEDDTPVPTAGSFVGTLNIAGEKADTAGTYKVDLLKNINEKTIPLNTEESICVIMRTYFDGALESETEGTAYVTTDVVSTLTSSDNNLQFGMKISALTSE